MRTGIETFGRGVGAGLAVGAMAFGPVGAEAAGAQEPARAEMYLESCGDPTNMIAADGMTLTFPGVEGAATELAAFRVNRATDVCVPNYPWLNEQEAAKAFPQPFVKKAAGGGAIRLSLLGGTEAELECGDQIQAEAGPEGLSELAGPDKVLSADEAFTAELGEDYYGGNLFEVKCEPGDEGQPPTRGVVDRIGELPRTGAGLLTLAAIGGGLLAAGSVVRRARHRA